MHKVYLTRRNLQTLVNKLDRVKTGDFSNCAIIKCDNLHAKYPQTMETCRVTAVEGDTGLPGNENEVFLSRKDLNGLLEGLTTKGNAVDGTSGVGMPYQSVLEIYALEDAEYYDTRQPGEVHPADDPQNKR